jgi:hypothetical protein
VEFVPGDLWVGLFVKRERMTGWLGTRWTAYICLLPCLPIRIRWINWDREVRWSRDKRRAVARERTR